MWKMRQLHTGQKMTVRSKKSVRFNDTIHLQYFSPNDRPTALSVSRITLVNFPCNSLIRQYLPVRVDDAYLSRQGLQGVIKVHNIAFEKEVAVRFTFDAWLTYAEVLASYTGSTPEYDLFHFVIRAPLAIIATLDFCARYKVGGQELWDNNCGQNYRVQFKPAQSGETFQDRISELATPVIANCLRINSTTYNDLIRRYCFYQGESGRDATWSSRTIPGVA